MRRLLIRPGAIGDCIVSLPALQSISGDDTEVWVAAQNVPLVRFVRRVRAISFTGLDLLEIYAADAPASLLETLRSFDSIVSWYGTARAEFHKVTERLGLPFVFLPALPAAGSRHAVDFYLDQARRLGGRDVEAVPRIACPTVARDEGYIVIHPFSGSRRKNWPLDRFRRVAEALASYGKVEWCAGPEEELAGAHRWDNLYHLACRLAGARLYIGNDSGISHLAAAAGAPVLALFGPTDPAVWAPRGPSVRIVASRAPDRSMAGIPVEEVTEAAGFLLRANSGGGTALLS